MIFYFLKYYNEILVYHYDIFKQNCLFKVTSKNLPTFLLQILAEKTFSQACILISSNMISKIKGFLGDSPSSELFINIFHINLFGIKKKKKNHKHYTISTGGHSTWPKHAMKTCSNTTHKVEGNFETGECLLTEEMPLS